MKRYPIFDVLRLLAALEVVRHHYTGAPLAFPAVPAFLAISGFCILGSYERSRSWPEFIWKRICRVYPAFFGMLALVLVFGGLANVWAVFVAYVTLGLESSGWNHAIWSLGWEELYYGLLAVLFTIGAYKRIWPIWICLAAAIAWGTLLPIAYPQMNTFLRIAMPLGAAFFAGNLTYIYRERLAKLLWLGPLLLAASVWLYGANWIMTATLVISIGVVLTGLIPLKLPKFADISYGIYIYHVPVVMVLHWRYQLPLTWTFVGAVAVSLASWYLIEKPALKLKDRPPSFGKAKPVLASEPSVV